MGGTMFTKNVQFEHVLEIEIVKVRNNNLMELFQINWETQSFQNLESCFFFSEEQDEPSTDTRINPLVRFEPTVIKDIFLC